MAVSFSHAATENPLSAAGSALGMENSGGGARAGALGSAFVSVADDSSAILWNPAGLAGLTGMEAAVHHNSWIASTMKDTVVFGMPVKNMGGMAAYLGYVNFGSFDQRDSTGLLTGSFNASDIEIGAGWGLEVAKGWNAGLTLKDTMQTLSDQNYNSLGADLGVIWKAAQGVRLGLAYTNLGTQVGGSNRASGAQVGGSYNTTAGDKNNMLFAGALDFESSGDGKAEFGVEDSYNSLIAGRIGYVANFTDQQQGGLNGLSFGLGLTMQKWVLDYAFLPYGDLGSSQQISLVYQLGQ